MNRFNQNTSLPNITGGPGINVNQAGNNYKISSSPGIGTGDVIGPSASIDNSIPIFDGTTGKVIKSSGVVCDASNNLTGVNAITSGGLINGAGFKTPSGTNIQYLMADGSTTSGGGGGGITNPLTEALYPASSDIDLGTTLNPFRKLYVQNQTIELVNPLDENKSGSLSIINGNIQLSSNSDGANVNLGHQAGLNTSFNSTSIGNYSNQNSISENLISIGYQSGRDNNQAGSISIGNNSHLSHGGVNAIAIGAYAGASIAPLGLGENGDNSICIGQSAGQTNAHLNSIILNATSNELNSYSLGLFVNPIRENNVSATNILQYDLSTKEITATNAIPGGSGDVSSSISTTVNGAIPTFDGTTGKLIKASGVLCDASNNLTGVNSITSDFGFRTPSGSALELLVADGTVNGTVISNIATNTSNITTNTSNIATNTTAITNCVKQDASNNIVSKQGSF